jgi:hypothetical protein
MLRQTFDNGRSDSANGVSLKNSLTTRSSNPSTSIFNASTFSTPASLFQIVAGIEQTPLSALPR